ncbi:MAG TPA: penicillin-insensitive murein endopeptidase [Polyangia bacterium]|jgi:penicillin-insensitive murein endopeptidase|nr:penicillin-insensitive murein endopeptidase [Polyangia bacterium]
MTAAQTVGRTSVVLLLAVTVPLPSVAAGGGDARRPPSAEPSHADWSAVIAPSAGPARVVGGAGAACIAGAVPLPLDGPGYAVVDMARRRYFGHPRLVSFVRDLGATLENAKGGTMLVGDLAQPRGGPMSSGHVSHQGGLDVDLSYQFDRPGLSPSERDLIAKVSVVDPTTDRTLPNLWGPRQVALVRLAASDPRVARVFVAAAVKRELCRQSSTEAQRRWLHLVRPWPGHEDHLHVRLHCPPDSPACVEQPPPPADDGCGRATLMAALARDRAERLRPLPRPNRHLPPRCAAVFEEPAGAARPPAPTAGR